LPCVEPRLGDSGTGHRVGAIGLGSGVRISAQSYALAHLHPSRALCRCADGASRGTAI